MRVLVERQEGLIRRTKTIDVTEWHSVAPLTPGSEIVLLNNLGQAETWVVVRVLKKSGRGPRM